jgi:2,3-bisphosphoglycerate-dependent phosphoglycerate mutase
MPDSCGGQPTRVFAIRHGETAWNVDNRIQGQLDVPLNDIGLWQAQRVAAALADEEISTVYCSDLLRARQTAEAIAREGDRPLVNDIALRERHFGIFEGLTWREIEERWPAQSERWRRREPEFGPEGGEALRDFYARSVEAATRLAQQHPGETIALVAHGGVMDCLYRAATRAELQAARSWQLGNASINRLLYTPQGFTLVGWSDTGHLERGPHDEFSDGDTSPAPSGQAA